MLTKAQIRSKYIGKIFYHPSEGEINVDIGNRHEVDRAMLNHPDLFYKITDITFDDGLIQSGDEGNEEDYMIGDVTCHRLNGNRNLFDILSSFLRAQDDPDKGDWVIVNGNEKFERHKEKLCSLKISA